MLIKKHEHDRRGSHMKVTGFDALGYTGQKA